MDTRFKFTKTKLAALEYAAPGKRSYYHDTEVPGMGLTVTDKSKTFFVQYGRAKSLRRHALTDPDSAISTNRLGAKDRPGITVEIARKRASAVLVEMAADGRDPIAKKRAKAEVDPEEMSVRQAWEAYKEANDTLRESTVIAYEYAMNPVLGDWMDRKLFSLTPDEILARHNSRHSKSQAKHAFRVLRAIYNHHIRMKLLDRANPVAVAFGGKGKKAVKLTHKKRRKTLIEDHTLSDWFDAVEALPDLGQRTTWQGETARDLFLFQLFTGLRSKSECASLEWSQVDLRKKTIT
ncbi:MAG: integrase arm-type DNA-binding domain-containing protein, partial [Gammaproteobacteria bacterium]|nr:integrase arm-type DNA-binding domain-containing protein [Gammaproteobacteria bacterium]